MLQEASKRSAPPTAAKQAPAGATVMRQVRAVPVDTKALSRPVQAPSAAPAPANPQQPSIVAEVAAVITGMFLSEFQFRND